MIAPELALALSLQSGKGIYALLLGSGVSRSSGVPTGWEVVLDLIRKLARLQSADSEPDPQAWYRQTFGEEPNYSTLLDQVTGSPAERTQLLRSYFEPTDEEREQGMKLPTLAHRSIAALVAKGYVRVVVTTNFDRLLEQALTECGVQPVVISSSDAAQGALPLAHTPCTIIKINGDYLDTRFRNTKDELAAYEVPLARLLDQVLDEYGLVVCGWSGDWDIGLRSAIERCHVRRFSAYWATRGEPSTRGADLINLRRAFAIPITDADTFFGGLLDKVIALETLADQDPISSNVAVARAKRYLTSDAHRISLHDLLHTETDRAIAAYQIARAAHEAVSGEAFLKRLQQYEGALTVLLPVVAATAYWAEHQHDELLVRCLQRVADDRRWREAYRSG